MLSTGIKHFLIKRFISSKNDCIFVSILLMSNPFWALVPLLFISNSIIAQKFLVLETQGQIKTRKYPIGADIRIHFKEDKKYLWHQYTILGLDEKEKCIIVSDNYCIPLKEINGFDLTPNQGNAMAKATAKFAIPYLFYSGIQVIRGPKLNNFQIGLGVTSILSWMAAKLFMSGKVNIATKRRLKIIDLTLEAPKA